MKIIIDPGHGGKFTGAVCNGVAEKDINLRIALKLCDYLIAKGVMVGMTRAIDTALKGNLQESLQQRCNIEHLFKPDLFISIHCNACDNPAVHGFEVFTTPGQTDSDKYATAIFNTFKERFPGRKYRSDMDDGDPDREENFKVLRGTKGAAVLVELGFLSNDAERAWLMDAMNQRDIALVLAIGIKGES